MPDVGQVRMRTRVLSPPTAPKFGGCLVLTGLTPSVGEKLP